MCSETTIRNLISSTKKVNPLVCASSLTPLFVEKEVFDCLLDSDQEFGAYEDLEDDFVLLVNDNKPALELIENSDEDD